MAIADSTPVVKGQRKKVQWSNIALGGIMNLFEASPAWLQFRCGGEPGADNARDYAQVTTLGQPLEVVKTQMASARGDPMKVALQKVWARGGPLGCEPTPHTRSAPFTPED